MSDLRELHCFNPQTGKRDGGYCAWEQEIQRGGWDE